MRIQYSISIGIAGLVILTTGVLVGGPMYAVWQSEKSGQASYAAAESTRRITVLEAQAKLDSAKLLADAEVARAEGVARANAIIGKSLEGNEAYLRYLWIQALEQKENEVIYVPTEANLPIMEAGRAVKGKP